MDESKAAKDVVSFCSQMGISCSIEQATAALKPHRGRGDPQGALLWLVSEDGFDILEREKNREGEKGFDDASCAIKNDVDNNDETSSTKRKESSTENEPPTKRNKGSSNKEVITLTDDDDVARVLELCHSIGVDCSEEQAAAALAPTRGCGVPEDAVYWLTSEEGLQSLEQEIPKHQQETKQGSEPQNASTPISSVSPDACSSSIQTGKNVPDVDSTENQPSETWTCSQCTFINSHSNSRCECCDNPGPFHQERMRFEEALSKLKAEALELQEEKERIAKNEESLAKTVDELTRASTQDVPDYWDPFPSDQNIIQVELMKSTDPKVVRERERIIQTFKDGGMAVRTVISLKRLQHLPLWQRYSAQCKIVAEKPSNGGNPNINYVFHGPRTNTDAIIKNGFLQQKGRSSPYGTWTHTSSAYSGGSFADVLPDGSRRIFICQAAIGTAGMDDGSGRCPNEIFPGVLADCHGHGGIYVFYVDSQLYAEYMIQWK